MSSDWIKIDDKRCIYCGKCAAVCPRLIFLGGKNQVPRVLDDARELCIECGHCVAICPSSAIVCGELSPANSPKNDPTALPSFEQYAALVKYRRSIRHFKPEQVRHEDLERFFDLLRWAPTARNLLPLNWLILNDRDEVHRLAKIIVDSMRGKEKMEELVRSWDKGNDWVHRGAPCLAIAWTEQESEWNPFDSTIAAEILDLGASIVGLGSCWAGYFIRATKLLPNLKEQLRLPPNGQIGASLMLGYPDGERYLRTPSRPPCRVEIREAAKP